ncbi:hypothetical protein [Streptomyces malaysiensis]|uniref:Uncharacterized protein n=1 Tax=Streptomyces malaysiensis subsp. samsunensis TaxID=459658 RepID=A0A9X2RTL8_STRMQ|nr:hypothetical protein [Streptomyces samsunensis]MCQ8830382.1 hypothetical protein [Streptomyces samsunensis]
MDRGEILSLYAWATGTCFRCAKTGTPTILLAEITPPAGDHYEVRVCERCVLELEDERRRYAERTGREYKPGRLGRCEP